MEAPVLTTVQFSDSDIDRRFCSQPKEHPGNTSVRAEAAFNYRSHSLVFTVYKQDLLEKLEKGVCECILGDFILGTGRRLVSRAVLKTLRWKRCLGYLCSCHSGELVEAGCSHGDRRPSVLSAAPGGDILSCLLRPQRPPSLALLAAGLLGNPVGSRPCCF